MSRHVANRRRFLQTTAASSFAFTFLPRRVWGANERLQLACIGVGGKGAGEVRDLAREGCQIVALCDVDQRRAGSTFEQFPTAARYRDFRQMLDKEGSRIDAVTVSTPDHTHAVAAVRAMKMGKHVYCQKPLTHSLYEARVMAQTAAEMGVATQMGNQAHAGEPIRRAVEWVRAGLIGPVREAHVWTNRPIWPQGLQRPTATPAVPAELDWDLWLGPAPDRPYHPSYVPFAWRGWWDFGTGALGDMGCHIMDMPYWALQLNSPTQVSAQSGGGTAESPPLWSTVRYEFPARGDQPPVTLTWYDGKKDGQPNLPPREVSEGEDLSRFGCILVGDQGKFFFSRRNLDWLVKPQAQREQFTPPEPWLPRVQNEDAEWVAACRGETTALSNFGVSGPFTETVLLGNLAIRAGQPITWDHEAMQVVGQPELEPLIRRPYRSGWSLT